MRRSKLEDANNVTNIPQILIVDDKSENLVAMKKTLTPLKLQIVTASSGNEALQIMLNNEFAVVLLDVMMPDMSGFEVAELMHQNDVTKLTPIIFITAMNKSEQYYIKGMEVGAIDYLYKPIDPMILLSKVKIFVDLYTVRNKLEKTILKLNEFQKQLQENNLQLKQLSEMDMLTKTANRRFFVNECTRLLEESSKSGTELALFFLDVDDFKSINDKNGHIIGDHVLAILSERLNNLTNDKDLINTRQHLQMVARLGGDEFAMLVSGDATAMTNIEFTARRILEVIGTDFNCIGKVIPVTISIGVAIYPGAGGTLTELLHAADVALYASKSAGKNMFKIYQAP